MKIELIDGEYFVEKDKYQWILTHMVEGKDKHGNKKMHPRETYHANLEQVCGAILDRKCGQCESLEDIINLLDVRKKGLATQLANMWDPQSKQEQCEIDRL